VTCAELGMTLTSLTVHEHSPERRCTRIRESLDRRFRARSSQLRGLHARLLYPTFSSHSSIAKPRPTRNPQQPTFEVIGNFCAEESALFTDNISYVWIDELLQCQHLSPTVLRGKLHADLQRRVIATSLRSNFKISTFE
jgi:hypothetical protein